MGEVGAIGLHLQDHLGRAYNMLRDTILRIPEEVWRFQPEHGPMPAYVASHVIEIQDGWTSGLTEEQFPWGERVGRIPDMAPDELPSQAELVDYLEDVRRQTMAFLERTDAELVAPIEGFDWAGGTTMGLMLHGLRHVMLHQGQLSVVQWQHAPEAGDTWQ